MIYKPKTSKVKNIVQIKQYEMKGLLFLLILTWPTTAGNKIYSYNKTKFSFTGWCQLQIVPWLKIGSLVLSDDLISFRMVKINKTNNRFCWRGCGKQLLMLGIQICIGSIESMCHFFPKKAVDQHQDPTNLLLSI